MIIRMPTDAGSGHMSQEKRLVAFVREDEGEAYVDIFETTYTTPGTAEYGDGRKEPVTMVDAKMTEIAMREAVEDFLNTDEGKLALRQEAGCFNWGDAIYHIPDEVWEKHGVKFIPSLHQATITVDQNESFVD